MLKAEFTGQFKKDYKLALRRGCNIDLFQEVVNLLLNEKPLPERFRDHALTDSRDYKGVRECHIEPDWLLVYQILQKKLVLRFIRTGTHSDLF